MEDKDLIALIGKKNGASLDKADPILISAMIFEALAKEMATKLAKIVADAAAEIATTSTLAENTVRVRGSAIVTNAAKWGAEQIRAAGDVATRSVVSAASGIIERAQSIEAEIRSMWRLRIIFAAISFLSVLGLISWQVWGRAL